MKAFAAFLVFGVVALLVNDAVAEPKFTVTNIRHNFLPYHQCVHTAYNLTAFPGVVFSDEKVIVVDNKKQITVVEYQAYQENTGQIGKVRIICTATEGVLIEYVSNEIGV